MELWGIGKVEKGRPGTCSTTRTVGFIEHRSKMRVAVEAKAAAEIIR